MELPQLSRLGQDAENGVAHESNADLHRHGPIPQACQELSYRHNGCDKLWFDVASY